jgi:alkyl hydroperoxide reductase subunit AhpC
MIYDMKDIFFLLLLLIPVEIFAQSHSQTAASENGYSITVTIPPYKNKVINLAHYYNKNVIWERAVTLNEEGTGVFSDSTRLPGGVYIIYLNNPNYSFNLLIDNQQKFSVKVVPDSASFHLPVFDGSSLNTMFYQHQAFLEGINSKIKSLQNGIGLLVKEGDKTNDDAKLIELKRKAVHYEDSIIRNYPGNFFAEILAISHQPAISQALPRNAKDSAERLYTKTHYWDHISFSDGKLVYTPFFDEKLDKYFLDVLENKPDSVIKVIDWMLLYARSDSVMNSFLLSKFLYASLNHSYGWDDPIFIHIYEKFIANKDYDWLPPDEKAKITQKAYYLMGHMIGSASPEIKLPDLSGLIKSSYKISSKYLVVCFWDAMCHHCTETLPRLDSIYQAKWKFEKIKILTVAIESSGSKMNWKDYIHNKHLEDWTNLYYSAEADSNRLASGQKGYTDQFDVWYYPSFFLLDSEKRFLAKKFTFQQLMDFVSTLEEKKKP